MRRLLCGQGPGRNFSLVSRERLLEGCRTIHTERGFSDSRAPDEIAAAAAGAGKRQRAALQGDPTAGNDLQHNPLYAEEVQVVPWEPHAAPSAPSSSGGPLIETRGSNEHPERHGQQQAVMLGVWG